MKLKQFHSTTLVVFEITDISLKITPQRLFKKETHEVLLENILIKDVYELEYHSKSILTYIFIFVLLFGVFAEHSFLNPHPDWTLPAIFGALAILFVIRFFIKRTKIYIPTKEQGLIRLFQKQPDKKTVEEFIYILEGKVNLASKKIPEKINLKEFIVE